MRTIRGPREAVSGSSGRRWWAGLCATLLLACSGTLRGESPTGTDEHSAQQGGEETHFSAVQQDWLRQAEALDALRRGLPRGSAVTTQSDAAGAVDGVKDGKYAFHTNQQPRPWWQVDLGRVEALARVVVYNRLDYAPGLHNADTLILLTSEDGRTWTPRYDNLGQHFGGISGAPPLEIAFAPGELAARFVRLQIPSPQPIFLHLDEVEIYGQADPTRNLALRKPADQSSISIWSTSKLIPPESDDPLPLPTGEVLERGRRLATDLNQMGLDTAPFEADINALGTQLAQLPEQASQETHRELYFAARRAVRKLAFANPLLRFDQLLFVKRFTQQTYPDICLNHMPWVSRPGGDLCVLDNPFAEGATESPAAQHSGGPAGTGPRARDGSVVGRRSDRVWICPQEVFRPAHAALAAGPGDLS